jgi:hypothetical protein
VQLIKSLSDFIIGTDIYRRSAIFIFGPPGFCSMKTNVQKKTYKGKGCSKTVSVRTLRADPTPFLMFTQNVHF